MNLRRFTAPDMSKALAMVKDTLGADAVILSTKKVRKGGMLSFLSKELVEITAATPDKDVQSKQPAVSNLERTKQSVNSIPDTGVMRDLQEEITELRGHVRTLADQVKMERMPALPEYLAESYIEMIHAGVSEKNAKELTQAVNIDLKGDQLEEKAVVRHELKKRIQDSINIRRVPLKKKEGAKKIALVGPTGVGKTTTLAKLVTSYRFWGRLDTALVSADTYRVAAIEQLKTFASIAGLPLETVYKPDAMQNILSRHAERDCVFVDTAGRSPADTTKLDELGEYLGQAAPDEVLLCLAVATRLEDQLDIIDKYKKVKPTGIIFTKLDESRGPGMILNALSMTDLPLTFLTCGQNVPDDILAPNKRYLADLILHPAKLPELQKTHFKEWIKLERESENEGANVR